MENPKKWISQGASCVLKDILFIILIREHGSHTVHACKFTKKHLHTIEECHLRHVHTMKIMCIETELIHIACIHTELHQCPLSQSTFTGGLKPI